MSKQNPRHISRMRASTIAQHAIVNPSSWPFFRTLLFMASRWKHL